jgi:hypothetical protein
MRIESLPVDLLDLDLQNPRIQPWIEQYENPDFNGMMLALQSKVDTDGGRSVTFQSLRESIRAHGGITTPIIVQVIAGGRYKVIEGNTRVAIFKSFIVDNIPGDWSKIPSLIYDTLEPVQVEAIRLQCHIVGAREWEAYAKARYLHHLRNHENYPLAKICELVGGRQREITELIDAYTDMEREYRQTVDEFDSSRFSSYVELQKSGVKKAISDSGGSLVDFANWIQNRNLEKNADVRALPRILANPAAKQKFLTTNVKEALRLLDVPAPPAIGNAPLEQILITAREKLEQLSLRRLNALKQNPQDPLAQLLIEVKDVLDEHVTYLTSE